jgi:RHS repeat-associated protein
VLERRRWPTSQIQDIETCLAVIRAKQTELFRLAELFIASVERHGYLDRAAICRVVDDCATLSFAATRDDFNLDRDLVEAPPTEWMQDKNPNFLPGLPVAVKLDVWRAAARHGLGSHVKWGLGVSMPDRVYVQLIDGAGEDRKEVFISLNVPTGQIDTSRLQPAAAPASYAADRMQAHWQRPPWQQALLPLPAFPHSRVPDGVPLPSVVQLAAPSVPMVTAFPWQVAGAKPGKHGFSTGRHYLPGVGVWISRVGFEEQWEGEHPYGYVENNPITNTDPTGESNKPTAPTCTTGTPVYVTCYSGTSSKDTAVYCQPANICGTCSRKDKKHKGKKHKYGPNCESFCKHCVSAPSTLGTPVFSRGTPICIVNADGTAPPFMSERTINDCGCGQGDANKPDPDNWIDVSDSGCSDGWYCASVKTAGKKCC